MKDIISHINICFEVTILAPFVETFVPFAVKSPAKFVL